MFSIAEARCLQFLQCQHTKKANKLVKNITLLLCFSQIYCSSSSFLLDSPDMLGASVESQEFFAGIRVRYRGVEVRYLCKKREKLIPIALFCTADTRGEHRV